MNRLLKRNLKADLESSQSNINADESFGTSGKKKAKTVISRKYSTTKIIFFLDSLSLGMSQPCSIVRGI